MTAPSLSAGPRGATPHLVLVGIIAVAAGLRLFGLEVQSLWHDELFSWYASQLDGLAEAVAVGAAEDVHPPGFIVFLYGWQRIAGDSMAALRLQATIAGIATCGWMFVLGRRWIDERVGLISAALMAVSWPAIYYSQEARAYSLLLLGCIALTERILAHVEQAASGASASRSRVLTIAVLSICMSYLHYFGCLFIGMALLAWGVASWVRGIRLRPCLLVGGVTAVAYLPWVSQVLNQVDRGKIWIPPISLERVLDVYGTLTNGQLGMALLLWGIGALAGLLWHTQRVGMSAREWLNRVMRSPIVLLIAWLTLPILATVAVSIWLLPVLTDRNLLIVLPAVVLLTAIALHAIARWTRGWPIPTILVTGLMLVDLFAVRDYYSAPTKWQYRAVVEKILAEQPDDRDFAVVSAAWHPSYFDYYFERMDSPVRVTTSARGRKQLVKRAQRAKQPVVFMAAPVSEKRKTRGKLRLGGHDRTGLWQFIGWDLYRFERHPSEG
jgi:mannosyltransferase